MLGQVNESKKHYGIFSCSPDNLSKEIIASVIKKNYPCDIKNEFFGQTRINLLAFVCSTGNLEWVQYLKDKKPQDFKRMLQEKVSREVILLNMREAASTDDIDVFSALCSGSR